MSYKYDPENGYRNADQIGADTEEYNEILYKLIQAIKKTKDTRAAMNMVTAFLREMQDYQEYMQEQQVDEQEKKQASLNGKNITITTNPDFVPENSQINNDTHEQQRKKIEVTSNQKNEIERGA